MLSLLFGVALAAFAAPAPFAQPPNDPANLGIVQGHVTTQSGSIPIGGAVISLADGRAELATAISEGDGRFRFELSRAGSPRALGK